MPDNPNQPTEYDAVLGGNVPPPVGGVILGGLEGVKRRLKSAVVEQRVATLKEALQYGEAGLDLVIEALQDESEEIQRTAYRLLRSKTEPQIKQALQQFNNWKRMRCLRTLGGHSDRISSVAISPDSKTLVSGSADYTIKMWDMHSGSLLRTLQRHSDAVSFVAITPDGKTVVSGSGDENIQMWDMHSGSLLHTLQGPQDGVSSVAISPDGKTMVSGSWDNTFSFWEV